MNSWPQSRGGEFRIETETTTCKVHPDLTNKQIPCARPSPDVPLDYLKSKDSYGPGKSRQTDLRDKLTLSVDRSVSSKLTVAAASKTKLWSVPAKPICDELEPPKPSQDLSLNGLF